MSVFGFHAGPGGNLTGIGDHWRTLDAAGIPAFLKSVDNYGPCFELANIAKASGVNHTIVYRVSTQGQNNGIDYDVPDYALSPVAAAGKHWTNAKAKLPPEFDKQRVWVEPINEVDRNRADWLGQFAVEIAKLANAQGYKVTLFGWSSGEPEITDWNKPGMLAYLRYCAANPGKAAVSLHEYSYNVANIKDGYPHKIGRFTQLLQTCNANNISYPEIHITEWGWEYQNVPEVSQAMNDIAWAHSIYKPYPGIKGAAIWYLGAGWSGIANKAQKLIAPVTQFTLQNPPDEPAPPAGYKSVVYKLAQEHTADEWSGIARLAYGEYKRTMTASTDNCIVMVKDGNADSYAVVFDPQLPSQAAAIQQLQQSGVNYQTRVYRQATSPLDGLKLAHILPYRYMLTSPFDAPRSYGKHEGCDYDVIGGQVDNKVNVLCAYDGVVDISLDKTTGYGKHVRVKHTRNGKPFYTRYAHLDARFVNVGDTVTQGTALGEIGATGNATGEHVHFNLEVPEYGLSGYVVEWVVNPEPYMASGRDTLPGIPAQSSIDMAKYFLPNSGNFGQIFMLKNNWGGGDERCQLQAESNTSYVTKNAQFEKRTIGTDYIDLVLDTSPGNGEYYAVTGHWLPRRMSPGNIFTRTETITFRHKSNCQPVAGKPTYTATSSIRFDKHHTTWTCPESGIALSDVAELSWLVNGKIDERYWFAAGLGLVRWEKYTGQKSWLHEFATGQSNNVRETGCFA